MNNLIPLLLESSDIPLSDLKKAIQKHSDLSILLGKRELDVEKIVDKKAFLASAKFLILNNRHVLEFVKSRSNLKDVSQYNLKHLRELRAEKLNNESLNFLREFVTSLFKEYSSVQNLSVSPQTKKELVSWANANGRYFDLSNRAQRELQSVPGLHPEKPIVLYRGLLFNSYDLKERERQDGTLELGKGLKFLRSIKKGSRVVNLEWDRPSSWTTSKEVAMRFAKFGPASSNFSATLQWLNRSTEKSAIDGDLGFIVSTLARPSDVLIDMDKLKTSAHLTHGSEQEYILAPGEYTCRVYTKYTREGEVDPSTDQSIDSSVQKAFDALEQLKKSLNISKLDDIKIGDWYSIDLNRLLQYGKKDLVLEAMAVRTKTLVLSEYEKVLSFYKNYVEDLDLAKVQAVLPIEEYTHKAQFVIDLAKEMSSQLRHQSFISKDNSRGSVKKKDLSPEQFREVTTSSTASSLTSILKSTTRFTDYYSGNILNGLLTVFTGKQKVPDLHRKGVKDQKAVLDEVLTGFFESIKKDRPSNDAEAVKMMSSALLAADRNLSLLSNLRNTQTSLDKL